MPKTTLGYSRCPECNTLQAVETDGLKHFIHCNECKTFTHYQTKVAKKRIEDKLLNDVTDTLEPVAPDDDPSPEPEATPEEKPVIEPVDKPEVQPIEKPEKAPEKPVQTNSQPTSLIDLIAQYL